MGKNRGRKILRFAASVAVTLLVMLLTAPKAC